MTWIPRPLFLSLLLAACSTGTPAAEDPAPARNASERSEVTQPAEEASDQPSAGDSVAGNSVGVVSGSGAVDSVAAGGSPSDEGAAEAPAGDEASDEDSGEVSEEGAEQSFTELVPANATDEAPPEFDVELDTTKGKIRIHVVRSWSPNGADRFYNLVKMGYYDDVAFFRVIQGFMAQVGMHGTPEVNARWQDASIQDDTVSQSNTPGMVTFAARGQPNSRTTQFFINMGNNANLDAMRFAPFGRTRDMQVVRSLFDGYGEGAPRGRGPAQGRIAAEGNTYLRRDFPNLDYIRTARVVE